MKPGIVRVCARCGEVRLSSLPPRYKTDVSLPGDSATCRKSKHKGREGEFPVPPVVIWRFNIVIMHSAQARMSKMNCCTERLHQHTHETKGRLRPSVAVLSTCMPSRFSES